MIETHLPSQQGSGTYATLTIEVHMPLDTVNRREGESAMAYYHRHTAEMDRRKAEVLKDLPEYARVINTRAAYADEVRKRLQYIEHNNPGMPPMLQFLDTDEKLITFANATKMRVHL